MPTMEPRVPRRTAQLCPAERPVASLEELIKNLLRRRGSLLRSCLDGRRHDGRMADFLVVLGIVLFAFAMLGLIWALDRV
jgi:hypothetical protein